MNLRKNIFILAMVISSCSHSSPVLDQVYLYLPDSTMKERIVNQEGFIGYIATIRDRLMKELDSFELEPKSSLGVIVTVRPGNESKIWYQQISGEVGPKKLADIAEVLESIIAPSTNGIVPFSFAIRLGGASEIFDSPPIDKSWLENQDKPEEVTVLIGKAWK